MKKQQRIILGIDPGTNILGYGVVLVDSKKVHYVDMGVVDLRKEKDHLSKLNTILTEMEMLIEKYSPNDLAVEAPFYGKNPQVLLKLGRAQGMAIAAALMKDIPVFEYSPRKVKMSITGNGAASKEQVAMILQKTLGLNLKMKSLDATDGLAIALCHFYQLSNPLTDISTSSNWADFVKSNPKRIV